MLRLFQIIWIMCVQIFIWLKFILDKVIILCRISSRQETSQWLLPPGNMGYPIVGETISFLLKSHTGEFFVERYSKYGPIFRTNFLGMNNIHVSDLNHVRRILLEEHRLVSVFWPPAMTNLLGKGALSTSLESFHGCIRKRTKQVMNGEVLRRYIPVMIRCISEEFSKWTKLHQIDVYKSAKLLTMKTACEVLLGPSEIADKEVEDLASDFVEFGEGFFQLPIAFPGSKYSKAMQAKKRIIAKLCQFQEQGIKRSSVMKSMFEHYEDHKFANDDETTNLTIEMLFGAQETTACTITCAMYLLEKYPHVLHRLQTEIEHHIYVDHSHGDDGLLWSGLERMHSLRYLNSVIKETLRMFPPIGGGYRKVLETFKLGEYTIPKNWTLTYSINDMHSQGDPDDVSDFDPDRWEADPDSPLHISQFLPFGAGARVCVGKEYAKLFVRLTIIGLVTQYKWTMEDKNPKFLRVPIVRPSKPLIAYFSKCK